MAKAQKRKTLTQQVRQHLEDCVESRYRVAKDTGIDEGTLSRFASGKVGLSSKALDKLGEYLGLDVVKRSGRRPATGVGDGGRGNGSG